MSAFVCLPPPPTLAHVQWKAWTRKHAHSSVLTLCINLRLLHLLIITLTLTTTCVDLSLRPKDNFTLVVLKVEPF